MEVLQRPVISTSSSYTTHLRIPPVYTIIGSLNLDYNVVGIAVSPKRGRLYATGERYTALGERMNNSEPCGDLLLRFFSVIDLHQLETELSTAHRIDTPAGFAPVESIASSDGKVVWVISRESNALLAFDADKISILNSSSLSANEASGGLLATVQVGTSPVGLTFARNETRIVNTESNRFAHPSAVT
jgi:DNA-binding beta-propeller fold protein YncE